MKRNPGVHVDLATIAADPERLDVVQPADVPQLLGELEALRARLWSRLSAASAAPPAAPPTNGSRGPDKLLGVATAAARLAVSKRWMYRHAGTLPFARRLSSGALRFSERGLERWKESKRERA